VHVGLPVCLGGLSSGYNQGLQLAVQLLLQPVQLAVQHVGQRGLMRRVFLIWPWQSSCWQLLLV
jgi:hypothetical protein